MKKRTIAICLAVIMLILFFSLSAWAAKPGGAYGLSFSGGGRPGDSSQPDLPRTPYPDSWPLQERPLNGWTVVFYDDFEGSFPDGWKTQGWPDYKWWKRDCRSYEGDHSAWCIGRRADDSWTPCAATCPAGQYLDLILGPFSLVQAAYAEVRFYYRLDVGHPLGRGAVYASTDGSNFYGLGLSPTTQDGCPDGWCEYVFDLGNVGSLGNLCGEPEVWIKFGFSSQSEDSYQGFYVDNVLVRAWIGANPPTRTPTPTLCKTPPWHPTCTPTFTPQAGATCTPTSTSAAATATATASITPGPSPTPSATWEVNHLLYLPVVYKRYTG